MCINLYLFLYYISPLISWTEAQLTCAVNTVSPLALSRWLCYILYPLSEFIPLKYSQRQGNTSHKLTLMQSTPPYSAALYLHYLLWDLSGDCSPPACLCLIHVVEGAAWVCSSRVSYLYFSPMCYVGGFTLKVTNKVQHVSTALITATSICFTRRNVLSVLYTVFLCCKQALWLSC